MIEGERGLFIVIDGPDGGGKSLQARLLKEYLEGKGSNVIQTREPGGTYWGEAIRGILLDAGRDAEEEIDPLSEMLAFYSARRNLLTCRIIPALEKGTTVICDRFEGSTYAYQGVARGLGTDKVRSLSQVTVQETGCVPDLYVVLDVPPEVGLGRKLDQNEQQIFEMLDISFHKKVRDGFREFVQRAVFCGFANQAVELDATRHSKVVHQDIVELAEELKKEKVKV